MSLITGMEALFAIGSGKAVQYKTKSCDEWFSDIELVSVNAFMADCYQFRLKPDVVRLDVELPRPIIPEIGEIVFSLSSFHLSGYDSWVVQQHIPNRLVWRTKEDIIQVRDGLLKLLG